MPTKVCLVKGMVFPVVTYGCENWTIKKAECQRTDAFELWCWRRLLRVPWTARRSNQSILRKLVLNIHWKDWCWSWNSNTLTTWCKELTHLKRPWCWERLKVGGEGDDRGWDGWMTSPTQWTWVWVSARSWWWTGKPGVLQSTGLQTQLGNWTEPPVIRWLISSLKRVPEASSFSISGNAFQVVPGALLHIHTVRSVFSLQFYSTFQWLLSCFYALEFTVKLQSASQRTLLSLLPETEI